MSGTHYRGNKFVFEALVIKEDLYKAALLLGDQRDKAPGVVSRALNRAAEATKTKAVKATASRYYVKQADVRQKVVTIKSSKTRLRAIVRSVDSKLPLERFKVSPLRNIPKKPPVLRIGVKREGDLKAFKGAFVIPNLKIYERIGKKRYPIKRLYGPAIPQMVGSEKTRAEVQIESMNVYNKRFAHEIKRLQEGKK
jgi:hypothetical protein